MGYDWERREGRRAAIYRLRGGSVRVGSKRTVDIESVWGRWTREGGESEARSCCNGLAGHDALGAVFGYIAFVCFVTWGFLYIFFFLYPAAAAAAAAGMVSFGVWSLFISRVYVLHHTTTYNIPFTTLILGTGWDGVMCLIPHFVGCFVFREKRDDLDAIVPTPSLLLGGESESTAVIYGFRTAVIYGMLPSTLFRISIQWVLGRGKTPCQD